MIRNTIKYIIIISVVFAVILLNRNLSFEKLKRLEIEKEKELGSKEVNKKLYLYNSNTPIDKLIATKYQYLWVLPVLDKYFRDAYIENLVPASPELNDNSIGYLLSSPSETFPAFISDRLVSGEYKEIFECEGYRFIKIR